MSETAIRVEGIRKRYRIGEREKYVALRDVLTNAMKAPLRMLRGQGGKNGNGKPDHIWALDGVSLQVKHGEAVGLIGRNGAGKTTLLKILSRITKPTEGRAEIHGRVGSLLEVGTGFHQELTGRENIYLNGAILGMKKAEIDRKFDEMVAFAEVETFLDTPVKHYSSGMYVRLAFAVAAHLEPEILLVDEVLAVGDAGFQKKCLGKMSEVTRAGRTVVFVSHNMSAIENLCASAYQIDGGRIVRAGETRTVVSGYLAEQHTATANPFANCQRTGNGKLRVMSFGLESLDGQPLDVARSGEPAVFAFGFENHGCTARDRVSFSFSVHTDHEAPVFHYYSHFSGVYFDNLPARGTFKCLLPELALAPGNYLVMCRAILNGDQDIGMEADWPQVFAPFSVASGDFYGTGDVNLTTWAPTLVKGEWRVTE
jgi:homopolymeric O-antigen transport system ATP-binding protein